MTIIYCFKSVKLLVLELGQANIKENIKALYYWPFVRETTSDWWFPITKGQWCGKTFPHPDVIMPLLIIELSARLWHLHSWHTEDTKVLDWAIDMMLFLNATVWYMKDRHLCQNNDPVFCVNIIMVRVWECPQWEDSLMRTELLTRCFTTDHLPHLSALV